MTPQTSLRLGNWLYLWLDAHQRSAAGSPTLVLAAPGTEVWLRLFPRLAELTVSRADLRFHDRREDFGSYRQRFGIDFTTQTLAAFINECIAPEVTPDESGALVINVRRGDYYLRPDVTARYGFDQVGYIAEAVGRFPHPSKIVVVSDDAQWCRSHLDPVVTRVASHVVYAEPDAVANFLAISGAQHLIGSNSTFSYWGAYVAGVVHQHSEIVMPRFHARMGGSPDAVQLHPAWTAVEGYH